MTVPLPPDDYPGPTPDPEMAAAAAEMAAADLEAPAPAPDAIVAGGRTGPAWDQLPPDTTWQDAR